MGFGLCINPTRPIEPQLPDCVGFTELSLASKILSCQFSKQSKNFHQIKMPRVLTQFCVPSYRLPLLPHFKRNGRELRYRPTSAKKSNAGENSQTKESSPFSLRISRAFVAKSAIIIFGLGFLDAA